MSRMSRFNFKFSLGAVLTLALVGLIGSVPANADIWPGLEEQRCMADAFGGNLNCTANDVEITNVNPIDGEGDRATLPDGTANPDYDAVECVQGSTFQLNADLTIRTNANERWDTTFYMPLNDKSPMDLQNNQPNCSLAVPDPGDISTELDLYGNTQPAYSDLDSDECADITKALGPDQYTLYDEQITMYCQASPDDPAKALFTYCAAWENQTGDNCYADVNYISPNGYYGQVPSQKSKCKCDAFAIDVFIKPEPPAIVKTLVGTGSHTEFGGDYTFELSFTNPSEVAAFYIQELTDEVDIDGDDSWDATLDLLNAGAVVTPPAPAQDGSTDGVYLKDNSNCIQAYEATDIDGEVLAGNEFKCQFTVHIIDTELPGLNAPELYDDAIKVLLWDKNNAPVMNGDSCTILGLPQVDGEHCSDEVIVEVTNLMPDIRVTKEASPNTLVENGGPVTFTAKVFNDASVEEMILTSLVDDIHGDLNGQGTCSVPQTIAPLSSYTCSFTANVTGNAGDKEVDTITATGEDNEGNTDWAEAKSTVELTNDPAEIELIKTADPTSIFEPGEVVTYTFEVKNLSTVDVVTINSLTDTIYGDLTLAAGSTCTVPQTLNPLGSYTCTIAPYVDADAAAKPPYEYNVATAAGISDDGEPVSDSDDAQVDFKDVLPTADLTKNVTKMLVTYQVVVTNTSTAEELFVDSLIDDPFGDITSIHGNINATNCEAVGQAIAIGGNYTCEFEAWVDESPHKDTLRGTISDNDNNNVTPAPEDSAIVTFGKP